MTTPHDEESYTLADLAEGPGTEPAGAESGTPPPETGTPPPAAPDPRIEEAEQALAEERARQAATQRELTEYQRRDENSRFEAAVQAEVSRRYTQLVNQNWGETEARQEAQSYGRAVIAERRITDAEQQLENAGRLVRAMQLEKETGTPAADLLPYTTPEEMERAARARSGESKRIADLEAKVAQLTQGAVPQQSYDTNSGTGGMSDNQLIAAYANGEEVDITKVVSAMNRLK